MSRRRSTRSGPRRSMCLQASNRLPARRTPRSSEAYSTFSAVHRFRHSRHSAFVILHAAFTMTMSSPVFGMRDPDARGYYGPYGGRFVPETLVAPIEELTA